MVCCSCRLLGASGPASEIVVISYLFVETEYTTLLAALVAPDPELRSPIELRRLRQEIIGDKDVVKEVEGDLEPLLVCSRDGAHTDFTHKRPKDHHSKDNSMVGSAICWVNNGILNRLEIVDADAEPHIENHLRGLVGSERELGRDYYFKKFRGSPTLFAYFLSSSSAKTCKGVNL